MSDQIHTPKKYSTRRPLTVAERNAIGGSSDIVAHLLFHRGIKDADAARKFLEPDYDEHLHDPFLLKDAEKAVDRIITAMENGERIVFYCDYDADGIPGAAMWDDFMRRIGHENYAVYIPHRHNEGFGVNMNAVEQLAADGATLIVTLDCGISDVGPIRRAVELGMDVIVTDHHEPPPELPPAYAIVDHKQEDCPYPDKHLCGTGVGFKVIQGVIAKLKTQNSKIKTGKTLSEYIFTLPESWSEGHEKWLLDMVGIATLSDMVPLTGENRVLASYGLRVLRKSPRKGLSRLLSKLKMSQKHLTEDDVAFMITPRINAASRMGAPMDAFRMLSATTDTEADIHASHLDQINNERKGIVASLTKEVRKRIEHRYGSRSETGITGENGGLPPVLVLGDPEWRPSLLGLVANSCVEEFGRPTFLWGRDGDGSLKGSCRAAKGSDVVSIMRSAPAPTFTQFGGHKQSGGFAVHPDHIHFLETYLNDAARNISGSDIEADGDDDAGVEYVDMEMSMDGVGWRLQEDIERLAPFGMGNPKPTFLFTQVSPASVRRFGKAKDHIELTFKRADGSSVAAIAFFADKHSWISVLEGSSKPIDLVASVEKSVFRGRKELRLRIQDVVVG